MSDITEDPPRPPVTVDRPAPGLTVHQPRSYRFGVEAYLLAAFALEAVGLEAIGTGETDRLSRLSAVDLGCGSGVVGLLLARAGIQVVGIEREDRWLPLLSASRAACAPEIAARYRFAHADARSWAGAADLVVTNPPWFPPDQPRSPDPWRANARSMLHGTTVDFLAAGLRIAPVVCVLTRPERMELPPRACAARIGRYGPLLLAEVRRGSGTTQEITVDPRRAYRVFGMNPP